MTKGLGKNDKLFLGMLVSLILGACFLSYLVFRDAGKTAEVTVDGNYYGSYEIKENQTIDIIIGERKANILSIKDGQADMTEADCPDKLCVHQKAISYQGESIVCLPNKVVVEIKGKERAPLDAVAD